MGTDITVITPPEFDKVLKQHVTMNEIDQLVSARLQSLPFQVVCLGQGQILSAQRNLKTFFFNVSKFYPHITVGFTDRDLHLEDGVVKDKKSCVAGILEN